MWALTLTYRHPELCSTTTPADCVAPLGACTQCLNVMVYGMWHIAKANDTARQCWLHAGMGVHYTIFNFMYGGQGGMLSHTACRIHQTQHCWETHRRQIL